MVIGGSFRYIIPTIFVVLANRYNQFVDPRQVSILSNMPCIIDEIHVLYMNDMVTLFFFCRDFLDQ